MKERSEARSLILPEMLSLEAINTAISRSFKSVTTQDRQFRFPVLTIGDYSINASARRILRDAEVNAQAARLETESSALRPCLLP